MWNIDKTLWYCHPIQRLIIIAAKWYAQSRCILKKKTLIISHDIAWSLPLWHTNVQHFWTKSKHLYPTRHDDPFIVTNCPSIDTICGLLVTKHSRMLTNMYRQKHSSSNYSFQDDDNKKQHTYEIWTGRAVVMARLRSHEPVNPHNLSKICTQVPVMQLWHMSGAHSNSISALSCSFCIFLCAVLDNGADFPHTTPMISFVFVVGGGFLPNSRPRKCETNCSQKGD